MTKAGALREWYSKNVERRPSRFADPAKYSAWASRADSCEFFLLDLDGKIFRVFPARRSPASVGAHVSGKIAGQVLQGARAGRVAGFAWYAQRAA